MVKIKIKIQMYDNIKVGMNTNIVILCICVIVEVSLIKKSWYMEFVWMIGQPSERSLLVMVRRQWFQPSIK